MITTTKTNWIRVSKRLHCPVCGCSNWCLVADDGSAAICPRTPSDKWVGKNGGGGYLHKLDGSFIPPPAQTSAKAAPKSNAELVNLMRQYRTAINPDRLERLAATLGLTVASLNRLGIGWAFDKNSWAFPVRSAATGDVLGIRLRTADGRKFSVAGGHEGLFLPAGTTSTGTIILCEGPTSCASLLDLGFNAVGRPSCTGGTDAVADLLAMHGRRDVVVFGDRDDVKVRPDGSEFRPGQEGAARLAQRILPLCRSVKVIVPPFVKDARDWKAAGATKAIIEAVIRAGNYTRKANQ